MLDSNSDYCPDCRRMIGVGCSCNLTFAEKIKSIKIPNQAAIGLPEGHYDRYPESEVSSTPPPPL